MAKEDPLLLSFLEPIIFNKKDFETLKKVTVMLKEGRMDGKGFKKTILNQRVRILKEMLGMIPFYQQTAFKNEALIEHASDSTDALQEELSEKDEFLEQVGARINAIMKRLMEDD